MKADFNLQNTDWIRLIDAQSRLTVWLVNHINSPEIAKTLMASKASCTFFSIYLSHPDKTMYQA